MPIDASERESVCVLPEVYRLDGRGTFEFVSCLSNVSDNLVRVLDQSKDSRGETCGAQSLFCERRWL
jgi:hypothetical protein